jgi:DNA-binding MarR family transcriptional regulator
VHNAKFALLAYLAEVTDTSAAEIAVTLERPLPATSMAPLRLVRSGLVSRAWDPRRRTYFYTITPRGQARVNYFSARRS